MLLGEDLIASGDEGAEHFHRADYIVYVSLRTVFDINYLFPFRKKQNSCPHFTDEKLTL